jgi:hypothetical protein
MLFRALFAALAGIASASISSCGSAATRFQLTALDFQPAAPSPGDEVFMTVEFTNPGITVQGGTAHRTVSLNGLPIVDETVSLCNEATACPLTTGFNNRSAPSTWPDVTGKIASTVRWADENGDELLCIKTVVTTAAAGPRLRGVPPATISATQKTLQIIFQKYSQNQSRRDWLGRQQNSLFRKDSSEKLAERIRHIAQPVFQHSTALVPLVQASATQRTMSNNLPARQPESVTCVTGLADNPVAPLNIVHSEKLATGLELQALEFSRHRCPAIANNTDSW